jgi:hypothetical protein
MKLLFTFGKFRWSINSMIVISVVGIRNVAIETIIAERKNGYFANCVGGSGSRQLTTGPDVVV